MKSDRDGFHSLLFTLHYNASWLEYRGLSLSPPAEALWQAENRSIPGEIKIVLAAPRAISLPGELLNFEFVARRRTHAEISDADGEVYLQNLQLDDKPAGTADLASVRFTPVLSSANLPEKFSLMQVIV